MDQKVGAGGRSGDSPGRSDPDTLPPHTTCVICSMNRPGFDGDIEDPEDADHGCPRRYPDELRERARCLAVEARKDPAGRAGAIKRIAGQRTCTPRPCAAGSSGPRPMRAPGLGPRSARPASACAEPSCPLPRRRAPRLRRGTPTLPVTRRALWLAFPGAALVASRLRARREEAGGQCVRRRPVQDRAGGRLLCFLGRHQLGTMRVCLH